MLVCYITCVRRPPVVSSPGRTWRLFLSGSPVYSSVQQGSVQSGPPACHVSSTGPGRTPTWNTAIVRLF